jgi:class 3 adenylate cyclase/predicted ATPase
MDVVVWLRSLGLEQYEAVFRENEIDESVLTDLTEDHLRELGFPLGARLKILKAIAALHTDSARSTNATAKSATPSASPEDRAERRQVTVMFSDLVGSTALSARMDPEDLREVISAYQKCVAKTVRTFGGFVANYMGDGVLVYFGYPEAHEDDTERAVRAGLELIAAVTALKTSVSLQTRVGIATGLVVVGDLIGSGETLESGIVGETPNLAARLQGVAEPNTVVIAESTRKLLGNLIEFENLGPKDLKGIAGPVRAWAALRPSSVESRFEALRASALTPLVGREEEIELLLRRWQQAKAGAGRVVMISGEPGIGKSRLTAALRDRLEREHYRRLRYFCSPHHQDSALYPFISRLEHAARFEREDPPDEKLAKLEALLAPALPSAEDVGLIAELLSLPATSRYPLPTSTPQRKKEMTFEAMLRQLEALARQKPIVMVFEDLHWIDPSSRELLDRIIERIAGLPVLLLATFRPEFTPPWTGLPHVMALTLARLDRRTGAAMVEGIAGNAALSSELAAEIVERADGIPLFVEELTKAVLEEGGSGAGIEKTLARAVSPSVAVPAALHASLMARLDRLGKVPNEIAQIAAAIGREFSYELVAPLAQLRQAELLDALGRLADAGLIFRRGTPPYATYLFKHALVRDVAYGSLLRRRRKELHARIAAVLEADFAERVEAQPELLARHLTEAGLFEKAVGHWQRAGERATARSANAEAVAHLKRGIEIVGRLPESQERDEKELLLQAALIAPFSANEGYASTKLGRAARRAVALGLRIGVDSPTQFQAVWARRWLAVNHLVRGELRTGLPIAEEALGLAERLGDTHLRTAAHHAMGIALVNFGDLAVARQHLGEGITLYDPERDRTKAAHIGFDVCMACHALLGLVLWQQGFPEGALCHGGKAIAAACAAAHPLSEAHALNFVAIVHQLRGETTLCLERAGAALALATEQMLPFWAAQAMVHSGSALAKGGQSEKGLVAMRAGLDAYHAMGIRMYRPHFLALLAEACLETGRIEEGLSAVREALAEVKETEVRWYEAELNRLEGELLLASEEPDESRAEASFRKGITIACGQGAKSWELRAAMSLARLWRDQGKRQQARELLAPVYGWFTEGFDTRDLKEAKVLLEELAS